MTKTRDTEQYRLWIFTILLVGTVLLVLVTHRVFLINSQLTQVISVPDKVGAETAALRGTGTVLESASKKVARQLKRAKTYLWRAEQVMESLNTLQVRLQEMMNILEGYCPEWGR